MSSKRSGIISAIAAFLMWGVAALFWREIKQVPSIEILAHRALWSAITFVIILAITKRFAELKAALKVPSNRKALLLSTVLIACNWYTFVYSIQTDRLLHASFGYFINPMVNVACGLLFFSEKLRPLQKVALVVVCAGIAVRSTNISDFPWISFVLAGSFAAYGVVRKKAKIEALTGNAAETLMMLPFACTYLIYLGQRSELYFLGQTRIDDLFLLCTGPVTLMPMLCFCDAARKIPLTWLGQFQYISPTMQFLLAIYYFQEASDPWTWGGFSLVWLGLLISTISALRKQQPKKANLDEV